MERSIARSLEPDLRDACEGSLGDISWVRMDWQHGGALTGVTEYTDDAGTHPVFVKFPVPGRELRWTRFFQDRTEPLLIPRLHASGASLGNHDIAWLVLERLDVHDHVTQRIQAGLLPSWDKRLKTTPCGSGPDAEERWRALGSSRPPESFFEGAAILAERPLVDGHR